MKKTKITTTLTLDSINMLLVFALVCLLLFTAFTLTSVENIDELDDESVAAQIAGSLALSFASILLGVFLIIVSIIFFGIWIGYLVIFINTLKSRGLFPDLPKKLYRKLTVNGVFNIILSGPYIIVGLISLSANNNSLVLGIISVLIFILSIVSAIMKFITKKEANLLEA